MKLGEMEERSSRSLFGGKPVKDPSWLVWSLMKLYRIVLLTILWTGLGMALGLFCGIIATVVHSAVHHANPDMRMAYQQVAVPVAVLSGSCSFLWNLGRAVQAGVARKRAMAQGKAE